MTATPRIVAAVRSAVQPRIRAIVPACELRFVRNGSELVRALNEAPCDLLIVETHFNESAAAAALSYARAREETFPVVCVRDVPFAKPPYAALNALRAILGAAGADAFIDLHAHANDEAGNACARAILEPLLRRTPPPPAAPGLRLSHR